MKKIKGKWTTTQDFKKTNPKKFKSLTFHYFTHALTNFSKIHSIHKTVKKKKKNNQIHLTNLTTKSIKTHTNSSHESNPKPSNLRSKAKQKQIERSTCHASSVRWKSWSHRSACIRNVSSGWWYSAFRASFTVFCSSIFWTHKINQNQTSSYSI